MNLKNKRVLFYVPNMNALTDGIYHTQVFGLAQYLVRCGAECAIVHTDASAPDKEQVVDGVRFWSTAVDARKVSLFGITRKLRRMVSPLEGRICQFAPTHVYARESYAGLAALSLARMMGAKLVFSCRGAGLAKSDNAMKVLIKEFFLRVATWRMIHAADHVSSVCQNLQVYLRKFYRCRVPMSVLPCCSMPEKFTIPSADELKACRARLQIPETARVIVYCGGVSWYQDSQKTIKLMKEMLNVDSRLLFLFITKEQKTLKELVRRMELPEDCYRSVSCKPSEVSKILKIGEVAFCLRTQDVMTRLSSPVKIGEYLAAGLGLILSPWIGDMGRELSKEPFAMFYDGTQTADAVMRFVNSLDRSAHERARAFAQSYYSYEGNATGVLKMFA